ncbi:MAG: hypothetical protein LBG99_09335 [Propionibacteriaceae bacterium]|jgi:hypothetical protein|nr:hypothetical protein [Propionibacteriaceae bacterium]
MKKLAKALVVASMAAGLALGSSATADAAGWYSVYAGKDYAKATTTTTSPTQGRSYAQHGGCVADWTPWTTKSSSAFADCGTSSSFRASVKFK